MTSISRFLFPNTSVKTQFIFLLFVLVPLHLKFCLSFLLSTIFYNTIVQKHLFFELSLFIVQHSDEYYTFSTNLLSCFHYTQLDF